MIGNHLLTLFLVAILLVACNPTDNTAGDDGVDIQPTARLIIAPSATIGATTTRAVTSVPATAPPQLTPVIMQADADVVFVRAIQSADGSWTFQVTVAHPDTGWEDYADGWDVVTPDGVTLKTTPDSPFTRLLLHPHETEQPFTRSQSGIIIPDGVTWVTVRAHDLLHGFGGQEVEVDLTLPAGENFEVEKP